MPIVLVFADPIADPPNGNIPVKSQSNFANTEVKELTPEFDNNTTNIQKDVFDIEDRNNQPQKGSSNFLIRKLNITKNNLVRVVDLDKEWKLSYDVTIYKMPAYDQKWLNLIHLTTNGNAENDNIFNLCMYRNGLVGKFSFHYWTQKKEMFFALGQTYHVVIEVFKTRRGRYGFAIILDGVDLVHKNLKCIGSNLASKSCHVRFCPQHCQWSPWGKWSACSKTCGYGKRLRKRTVVKFAKHGGRACVGSKSEKQSCYTKCPENLFHQCIKKWCYQKGTKHQYTKCKSVSKDGKTCYLPEIRYGSTVGGRPAKHSNNNILQWCKQLFPTSTGGTATYSNSRKLNTGKGAVFWCNGHDESGYHWCDNWNGVWKDSSLDEPLSKACYTYSHCRMTTVTCQAK